MSITAANKDCAPYVIGYDKFDSIGIEKAVEPCISFKRVLVYDVVGPTLQLERAVKALCKWRELPVSRRNPFQVNAEWYSALERAGVSQRHLNYTDAPVKAHAGWMRDQEVQRSRGTITRSAFFIPSINFLGQTCRVAITHGASIVKKLHRVTRSCDTLAPVRKKKRKLAR